jgi:hypothetical protein
MVGGSALVASTAYLGPGSGDYAASASISARVFGKVATPRYGTLYVSYNLSDPVFAGASGEAPAALPRSSSLGEPSYALAELHYGFDLGKLVFLRLGKQLLARARGFEVLSPDYSHTHDPRQRVAELHTLAPRARTLVLAGSSMGGYVSAMACARLSPTALFLMAPALYFPGWEEEPEAIPSLCCVVHGWDDEIVPRERALRFAQRHRAELHLLRSDHSLNDRLHELGLLFGDLLDRAEFATASAPQ